MLVLMKISASVSKEYKCLTLVVPLNQANSQSPALYDENGLHPSL